MEDLFLYVAAFFALANTVLIVVLLLLYSGSLRKVRSSFTLGLLVFAVFFLMQNIAIIVFWFWLYTMVSTAASVVNTASPYMTVINAVETIALIILVHTTMK